MANYVKNLWSGDDKQTTAKKAACANPKLEDDGTTIYNCIRKPNIKSFLNDTFNDVNIKNFEMKFTDELKSGGISTPYNIKFEVSGNSITYMPTDELIKIDFHYYKWKDNRYVVISGIVYKLGNKEAGSNTVTAELQYPDYGFNDLQKIKNSVSVIGSNPDAPVTLNDFQTAFFMTRRGRMGIDLDDPLSNDEKLLLKAIQSAEKAVFGSKETVKFNTIYDGNEFVINKFEFVFLRERRGLLGLDKLETDGTTTLTTTLTEEEIKLVKDIRDAEEFKADGSNTGGADGSNTGGEDDTDPHPATSPQPEESFGGSSRKKRMSTLRKKRGKRNRSNTVKQPRKIYRQ